MNLFCKPQFAVVLFIISLAVCAYLMELCGSSMVHDIVGKTIWQSADAVHDRLTERTANLDAMCKTLGPFRKQSQPYIRMNYGQGILACTIPKAGSSTIKAILGNYSDNASSLKISRGTMVLSFSKKSPIRDHLGEYMQRNSPYNLCMEKQNTENSINKRPCPQLPSVIRVLNVRHPLERLISAYRQKFGGGANITFINNLSQSGLKQNGSKVQKGDVVSVTFSEFLEHILSKSNYHWNTYNRLCSPCHFKYDYIMHSETMNEDLIHIMLKVGLSILPTMIHRNPSTSKTLSSGRKSTIIQDYFSTVSKDLVDRVMKKYKSDIMLFGYPIKNI